MKFTTTLLLSVLLIGSAHAQTAPVAPEWMLFDKTTLDQQVKAGINSALIAGSGAALAAHPQLGFAECRTIPTWLTIMILEKEIKRLEAEVALRNAAAARGPAVK